MVSYAGLSVFLKSMFYSEFESSSNERTSSTNFFRKVIRKKDTKKITAIEMPRHTFRSEKLMCLENSSSKSLLRLTMEDNLPVEINVGWFPKL